MTGGVARVVTVGVAGLRVVAVLGVLACFRFGVAGWLLGIVCSGWVLFGEEMGVAGVEFLFPGLFDFLFEFHLFDSDFLSEEEVVECEHFVD